MSKLDVSVPPGDRPRLGELFRRLDEILKHLDREDIDLEDQMSLYREACGHLGTARSILDETRAEIEILTTDSGDPAAGALKGG